MAINPLLMELDELTARMKVTLISDDERATYLTWLAGISKAIRNYVKWDLDYHVAEVQYYDGNGKPELVLRTPWIWVNANFAVYVDPTGYSGFGPNAFAANTKLTNGTDFFPRIEKTEDGSSKSKSAILQKAQNINQSLWFPSDLLFRPAQPGGLAWIKGPFWNPGRGNIKVVTDWGFKAIPEDIKLAVTEVVSVVRLQAGKGVFLTGESLGDYSWSGQLLQRPELGTARQLLSSYRDVQI